MSASALLYETTKVLGKRRAEHSHLLTFRSAGSAHNTLSAPSTAPVIINGKLLPHTKKRYQCTYDGCNNAYSKPSRLAEHERSHTGEVSRILKESFFFLALTHNILQRPYHCITCNKSYLRETHLHAHARSHLPQSLRPFTCNKPGCEKRFWTAQHLSVHIGWHEGAKPFAVSGAFISRPTRQTLVSAQKPGAPNPLRNITNFVLISQALTPHLVQNRTVANIPRARNHLVQIRN